jgi:hypothetical protein
MFAVAGLLAMVLSGAGASADEVCTTPLLNAEQNTITVCGYTNAFAYAGVTVTIKILNQAGLIVGQEINVPVAALASTPVGDFCNVIGTCVRICRFEVTGNTFFPGYSRGVIEDLVPGVPPAGLPAVCNPF